MGNHRLHDLTLQVDGHGSHVGCLDHPFLGEHQLLWCKLVLEFISEDNNSVGVLEDAFKLMNSLEVVDLGEDSNLFASVSARIFDLLDVFHRSHIWHTDIVKVVLDSDTQDIILVLMLKNR